MAKHVHIHIHDADRHGVYYGARRLPDNKWGIVVSVFRNGRLIEENKNTQPWPTEAVAIEQAKRWAQEPAEKENLPIVGRMFY